MNTKSATVRKTTPDADAAWNIGLDEIVIGKDVLELLSSSMYLDPITIFREYVQNSADSIDEARANKLLGPGSAGRVDISLDPNARSIRIRDNGTGIPSAEFGRRLTSFGASTKRGTAARGFRGVGRLAGLGYCQELVFRSRSLGDAGVSELRWNCRRLKSSLREVGQGGDLASLVREIVSISHLDGASWPERFFEVELQGVIRHRNDRLLSATVVAEYLSQVAPVPFSSLFRHGAEISEALSKHVHLGNLEIWMAGMDAPITRPHSNLIEVGDDRFDPIKDVEFKEIPALDGGIAAVAWFLHHGYLGAIPAKALIKGVRLRAGNVQVGDSGLLEDLFAEPRFNAWSVGEVHVIDKRIVPNGRRDQFEQSVHYDNLLNQLGPAARDISRRCRTSSADRKLIRDFQIQEAAAKEKMSIVSQGSLTKSRRSKLVREIERNVAAMEKIASHVGLSEKADRDLRAVAVRLKAKLKKLSVASEDNPFEKLPKAKRELYSRFFDLIYECSTNRVAAKALVDRILQRIDWSLH